MEAFKIKNGLQAGRYLGSNGTETAGSVGYSISSASYDGKSLSVASQETGPQTIFIGDSNTKFYTLGGNSRTVYQYNATTASDISTASYASKSFDVSTQDTGPTGLSFNSTGTKMYVCGSVNDTIYQYTLTTAWDVSTASYDSVSFSVSSQDTVPTEVTFGDSGTKMYVLGITNDKIFQYSLTTAYDLSTASYASKSFSVVNEETDSFGFDFTSDGTKVFVYGIQGDAVFQYSLSTAWDISTASYDTVSLDTSSNETAGRGVAFNSDGSQLYIVGAVSDTIYQYSTVSLTQTLDLSTGHYFNFALSDNTKIELSNPPSSGIAYAAQIEITGTTGTIYDLSAAVYDDISFSIADQETFPSAVFFKPDGTKMYILGQLGDDVTEYDLSTAWDITTSVFNQTFSIAARETSPTGLFFKPDGTKMYTIGIVETDVNEYNLSTAWDISTASYSGLFSVAGQETNPQGIFFKPDGTIMYILGASGDDVNHYYLSTPWRVSTASFVQSFSVSAQDNTPQGIFFKPDGTVMYILGNSGNDVNEYNLSTAWNIATAVYNQSFLIAEQETVPHGLFIKPDGTKMYLVGTDSDAVFQYSLTGDATITWPSSIKWDGGVVASTPEDGKTSSFAVSTIDGGITYYGSEIAKEIT